MHWILALGLGLLLGGGALNAWNRRRRGAEREALLLRRVDAYIETIRRERDKPALSAMSDTELRDLLHAGALNLRAAQERRLWVLFAVVGATLFAGIVGAINEGFWGFAVALAAGAAAGFGVNEYLARRAREPLEKHGVDVERITVD